ncbi:MAG: UDP-N-acetylmuramoyl-tripeptide--D-alanyl-D-alanine ligase [Polyangia bacterium]
MSSVSLSLVVRATGAGLLRPVSVDSFAGVSIDTRSIAAGALYVAIRGERLDGHDFVAQAEAAGAAAVLVARGRSADAMAKVSIPVLEVDDPILAIGRLARAHRLSMPARVVALTGSVGKTSTKEMLASILAAAVGEAAVHKTRGNLNNHLGVPLTLLALEPHHRFAVVELGMSSQGEIAYLEQLARPDVVLCTTIAGVHVEQLGSLAEVARAKGEIFEGRAAAGQAIAIAPHGETLLDGVLADVPRALRRTFGNGGDVRIVSARVERHGTRIVLSLGPQTVELLLPIVGVHHAHNAAAAACAAQALGVDAAAVVAGLSVARTEKHRMQLVELGSRTVLDDCYNASPPSVMAALDALYALAPDARRVAILGDMLELGPGGPEAHEAIGRYAVGKATALVALGPLSRKTIDAAKGMPVLHTDDPTVAARFALEHSGPGDALLVKASRGMKLERVLDALTTLTQDAV